MEALTLFLRPLPAATAIAVFLFAAWQPSVPFSYPAPFMAGLILFVGSLVAISWKRLSWQETLEKGAPPVLAFMAFAFGFLLLEKPHERFLLSLGLAGSVWLTLELFYLLSRARARYPVNGLSRVEMALAPVSVFFIAMSLHGLRVFLRLPFWVPAVVFACYTALWFSVTSHPTADRGARVRWAALGSLVGLHIGFVVWMLPVAHAVSGALAAILFSVPLRIRRYAYAPVPSKKHAYAESGLAWVFFLALIFTSRWI